MSDKPSTNGNGAPAGPATGDTETSVSATRVVDSLKSGESESAMAPEKEGTVA